VARTRRFLGSSAEFKRSRPSILTSSIKSSIGAAAIMSVEPVRVQRTRPTPPPIARPQLSTNLSLGVKPRPLGSVSLVDRQRHGSEIKRTILEEKLAGFTGGISSGSLRAKAIQSVMAIHKARSTVRATVPKKQTITVTRRSVPPIIQIRKKPTQTEPGGRPVFRIQRRPITPATPTTRVPKPPEIIRATPTRPRKVKAPSLDQLTGGRGIIAPRTPTPPTRASQTAPKPKAIAKVEPVVKKEPPVSLHKSILKGISGGISTRIQQKIAPAAILPAVGAVGRVLTGRVAAGTGLGAGLSTLFGGGADGGACPSGWHLAKDGSGRCVRNRRMNFGNARAARRSVRRLKGARKLLKDIEKMMPSKTRTRRAPAHHHHPAAGGA